MAERNEEESMNGGERKQRKGKKESNWSDTECTDIACRLQHTEIAALFLLADCVSPRGSKHKVLTCEGRMHSVPLSLAAKPNRIPAAAAIFSICCLDVVSLDCSREFI